MKKTLEILSRFIKSIIRIIQEVVFCMLFPVCVLLSYFIYIINGKDFEDNLLEITTRMEIILGIKNESL